MHIDIVHLISVRHNSMKFSSHERNIHFDLSLGMKVSIWMTIMSGRTGGKNMKGRFAFVERKMLTTHPLLFVKFHRGL